MTEQESHTGGGNINSLSNGNTPDAKTRALMAVLPTSLLPFPSAFAGGHWQPSGDDGLVHKRIQQRRKRERQNRRLGRLEARHG